MVTASGAALGRFFQASGFKLGKCLHDDMKCGKPAIRAHSIQNARVLDLLAEDGHVIAPRFSVTKLGPMLRFERIGRNSASTFTGLCEQHDRELFRRLDTEAFDPADKEQLFQLAYRSATREVHAVMEGGVRMQLAYQDRVTCGLDDPNDFSPAGEEAIGHLFRAYVTYQYHQELFVKALRRKTFDAVQHDVFTLHDQSPVIAVSTLFSLPEVRRDDDVVRCALNIFPTSATETAVVFSYAKADARIARAQLQRIFDASGDYQKYELSKLILERIENFVLAPSHHAAWSDDKKLKITRAFIGTVANMEADGTIGSAKPTSSSIADDPDLMMF